MKIAVDIDGTLSQTFEKFGEELEKRGHDISGGPAEKFVQWETSMLYPNVSFDTAIEMYEDNWQEMRGSYDVYPGSLPILHTLPYELHALTNRRVFEDADTCSITQGWLDKHGVPVESIIHTSDKASVCAQENFVVLIEDSPKNALVVAEAGTHVLLFDKVYNRHVPDHPNITRFSHWIEVPKLLRRILE